MEENRQTNENSGTQTIENRTNSIADKDKIVQFSARIRQEDKEIFEEIQHALGDPIAAEVFSNIVNRYNMPLRTNEENARKIQQMEAEAADLRQQLTERDNLIAELQQQLKAEKQRANENAETANSQQLAYEKQLKDLSLKETQRVVSFLPDCLKAVEAVAIRESKRRGQDWSVSHVINFFIHSRFIKGQLNGDLKSLSDSECKQLGISLGKPQPMEEAEI